MILKPIYNFVSKTFEEIEELRSYDGELVDVSVGRMTLEEVLKIALPVAKEKEWIGKIGQPDLIADAPTLFHYTRRKQLVWSVCFSQYFTEEERIDKFARFKIESVTFAAVKIDDATGKVISADFIRPHFNEYYEPIDREKEGVGKKRQRQIIGVVMTFSALGGNIWVWFAAFFYGHIYKLANLTLPGVFIVGLGFIFFDLRETERIKRGEDISGLDSFQLITAR